MKSPTAGLPLFVLLAGLWALGAASVAHANDSAPPVDRETAPETEAEPEPESTPDPDPEPDAGWQTLGVTPDFGSAVESDIVDPDHPDAIPDELAALFAPTDLAVPAPLKRPKARMGFRPWLGVQGTVPTDADGQWGGTAGVRVVHQWWTLSDKAVRPSGETRLHAAGLFGGVRGFDTSLDTAGGTWLGPVGVFVGGHARADRRDWTGGGAPTTDLPAAVGVGPSASLGLKLGPVRTLAGVAPVWLVAGDRSGLADTPWDELSAHGGVVLGRTLSEVRLTGGYREVATGSLWEAALGVHIRFGQP